MCYQTRRYKVRLRANKRQGNCAATDHQLMWTCQTSLTHSGEKTLSLLSWMFDVTLVLLCDFADFVYWPLSIAICIICNVIYYDFLISIQYQLYQYQFKAWSSWARLFSHQEILRISTTSGERRNLRSIFWKWNKFI